ncbi:MAG: carbohydrate ABC transporter substrate-binding protein [Anaerolineae bacterium]|nr:carbohydrate ABC transporter substrate-binding protein [Anaerolineae bacterium]
MKRLLTLTLLIAVVLSLGSIAAPARAATTLTIESWRNDDLTIWQDKIIPAFTAAHPDISIVFSPTAPTEYDAALNTKLEGGTAGDLITCRPFDRSLALYQKGNLAKLNDLPGMENFGDVAKSAWITDDGADVFCVPMASVIHGFIYNVDAFKALGLEVPTTESEFFAALDKIKADGTYIPLVLGTADQWEAATMGYQNIGPNFWKGEEGRLGLIAGTEKYNAGGFLAAFESLAKWKDYLGDGYQAQKYPDSQVLFASGKGAIYPAGSWDISTFRAQADFELGAFKPYTPDGASECYISDHTDIAIGLNPASPNQEAAKTFLTWVASSEFAGIYSNALPGFFSLSNAEVKLEDSLAQEFVSWRSQCKSSIRSAYQILSRGTNFGGTDNESDLWAASAAVLNGAQTAQEAADTVEKNLEAWYKPASK